MTLRVLIVDDEKLARDELAFLLAGEKDIAIVGEAAGGGEAVALAAATKPDLVFLDIQMPEMDGFQVVRSLLEAGNPPLVIFATAYDQYAIKAFEVNALDYLLKPFEKGRLLEALERARRAAPHREEFAVRLRKLAGAITIGRSFLPRIVVRRGEDVALVDVDALAMLRREGPRVTAFTADGTYPANYRDLDEIETQLDPAAFIRLGNDLIVNIKRIAEVAPWSGGSYLIILEDAARTEVRLNRAQAKLLKSKAERLF